MVVLAWVVFIIGLCNIIISPFTVGKTWERTAGGAMASTIIGLAIALFAGIYLFT